MVDQKTSVKSCWRSHQREEARIQSQRRPAQDSMYTKMVVGTGQRRMAGTLGEAGEVWFGSVCRMCRCHSDHYDEDMLRRPVRLSFALPIQSASVK